MNSARKLLYLLILSCQIFCVQCSDKVLTSNYPAKPTKFILADRSTLLMRGHSTSFTDGYMDGCQSGQYRAGDQTSSYIKNQELININQDYLLGWEKGDIFCYEHMRSLIENSGSNDPSTYYSKDAIEKEKQRIWSELKK